VIEILRTNDPVKLSFAEALLREAGIEAAIMDAHASVMDGSVIAVQRRLMVLEADQAAARRILKDAALDPK